MVPRFAVALLRHIVFGVAQSINSANYAYFQAQRELLELPNALQAVHIFIEELLNLHRGQGIELFWRDTATVPTEEEYLLMISNKTGGLFRLAARLMQALSFTKYDVLPLAELLGWIFQIRDDYQNLCSEQMTTAKGFCEDLTEGKFSLPVIRSIRKSSTGSSRVPVLEILNLHTTDIGLKSYVLWYMQISDPKSCIAKNETIFVQCETHQNSLHYIYG
ncbi:geranylgeranyl pyrophosphate synthetase [Lambiella insularis]|nr:geranylgeranyl pyrophosphate synthetase [Lambiella insularis]